MKTSLGKIAYEAYCADRGWKSVKGEPLPPWKNVERQIQHAWNSSADAVARTLLTRVVDTMLRF